MDTLLFVRALILVLPSDSIQDRRFGDAAARRQPEPCTNAGRRQWRKESGAHQQARAENAMFRFKSLIGGRLRSRTFERQKPEARIGVAVLNRRSELGMPKSEAIRA